MKVNATGAPRESTPTIQSLDRGLAILEAVAGSSNPVSLAQLRDLLSIDHSSAFRLANTLKRRGFLACLRGRKDYVLGPSVWRISRQYDWSKMLVKVAHDHLKELTAETGETAHLAVREGKQALFVDHVTTNHVIAIAGQAGELVPLYCTAHGKALLTDLDKPQLQALFGSALLKAHTKSTIVTIEKLAKACAHSKRQGFTTDDGELVEGIRCVAAPIRDTDGAIIGSIGISAPLTRFPEDRYRVAGRQVALVAKQIGELLGQPEEV
jgi:DNA-binding IclR family transcriptional regulator